MSRLQFFNSVDRDANLKNYFSSKWNSRMHCKSYINPSLLSILARKGFVYSLSEQVER